MWNSVYSPLQSADIMQFCKGENMHVYVFQMTFSLNLNSKITNETDKMGRKGTICYGSLCTSSQHTGWYGHISQCLNLCSNQYAGLCRLSSRASRSQPITFFWRSLVLNWFQLRLPRLSSSSAPTVTDVNRLFCVGLRGLNNPDIVATDVDPRHRDPRSE